MDNSVKKLINLVLEQDSDEAILALKDYAKKLKGEGKYNDANYITDLLGTKKTVSSSAINEEPAELLILEPVFLEEEIINKNNDEVLKFVNIIKDKASLRRLGFLKGIIYGAPGTGKTTFVKDIAKLTNRKLFSISAGSLVSSLIGQTQKNIDLLFSDILKNYKNSIFIIDEFDSVIGSRDELMNKEYHRMIGSFNLMLDKLLPETIIFAITNRIDMIDAATLRRFNVKIFCEAIDIEMFLSRLFLIAYKKEISFDEELIKKLLKIKLSEINYALIDDFVTEAILSQISLERAVQIVLKLNRSDILFSKDLTDKDKAKLLNESYSSVRRHKNEAI